MSEKLLIYLFIVLSIVFINPSLMAQEAEDAEIPEVVVSATRTETELDKVGGSTVHLITEEDIEAKQQIHVEEILKEIPGIDISSNGGAGTRTNIYIRGSDNKGVLVLIDGIMYNNPSRADRGASLGNLTLDNIERIEVIKGSQSVLYGSNATAGVINIITKKGEGKPVFLANVEVGTYETVKYSAGSRGRISKFNYSVLGAHTSIGGFSTANDRNDDIPHDENTDEKDSWQNQTLSAVLGYQLSEGSDISVFFRQMSSTLYLDDSGNGYAGDRLDYDSITKSYLANPDGNKDRRQIQDQVYYGAKIHNMNPDKSFEFTLSYNIGDDYRELYSQDDEKTSTYKGNSSDLNWQGTIYLGDTQEITLGFGQFKEVMEQKSFSGGDSTTTIDKSAITSSHWLQDKVMLLNEDLIIVLGIRGDIHEKFGDATTYRAAPSFKIGNTGLELKASYGTGFQAPSLYNLYSSYGNVDLEAEKSRTRDYGLEYTIDKNRYIFGLTFFDNEFENQIGYDMATSKYANEDGKTTTNGYEAFAVRNFDKYSKISLSHAHVETENSEGEDLKRRPKDKTSLTGRARLGDRLKTSASIVTVGERAAYAGAKDKNGNVVEKLDGYTLINIAASYQISKEIKLYAKIDNLMDAFYEESWSYATPGRAFYGGIKGKF